MPLEVHPERTVELTSYDKDERSRLRSIVGWILAASLIGGTAIYAAKVYATEVPAHAFEDEVVKLRLFNAPCENAEAKAVAANSPLASLADKLQRADSTWLVQTPMGAFRLDFGGCWVEYTHNGRQGYAVAFEDKEIRFFPAEGFKKTKGTIGI